MAGRRVGGDGKGRWVRAKESIVALVRWRRWRKVGVRDREGFTLPGGGQGL